MPAWRCSWSGSPTALRRLYLYLALTAIAVSLAIFIRSLLDGAFSVLALLVSGAVLLYRLLGIVLGVTTAASGATLVGIGRAASVILVAVLLGLYHWRVLRRDGASRPVAAAAGDLNCHRCRDAPDQPAPQPFGLGQRGLRQYDWLAMSPMSMPRPSQAAKTAFSGLVPRDPAVTLRPMFGNLAAFVNGNMFAGLFGEDLFVRLPDAERAEVKRKGGRDFEPMPGRAMTGYVVVPGAWQRSPATARRLMEHALSLTRAMPAKGPARKSKPAAKARTHR